MTTAAPPHTPPPLGRLILRRTAIALALVALMLIPSAVLFVLTKQPSATYASMGTIVGVIAVVAGGRRIGAVTAVVLSLLAPLSIVAGLTPITGAALMALMTLTVGRLSVYGLHRAVMLVPIFLAWPMLSPVPWLPSDPMAKLDALLSKAGLTLPEALARLQTQTGSGSSGATSTTASTASTALQHALIDQRMDSTYLTWVIVFFFIGAIIPVLVLPFALKKVHLPKPTPHPRSEAVPYTITITVLTAVATYYFLDHPELTAGSFLIATVLVLTQVGNDIEWRLTIARVLGTLGGVLLLAAVMRVVGGNSFELVLGIPVPTKLYAFGLAFGVCAIIAKFGRRAWIYYVLITPAAALLNAYTTSQATDVGDQRVIDNLVGAALVIVASLITLAAARIAAHHDGDAPTAAPDAAPV